MLGVYTIDPSNSSQVVVPSEEKSSEKIGVVIWGYYAK